MAHSVSPETRHPELPTTLLHGLSTILISPTKIGTQPHQSWPSSNPARVTRLMISPILFTHLLYEASIRGRIANAAVILGLSLDPSLPCLR